MRPPRTAAALFTDFTSRRPSRRPAAPPPCSGILSRRAGRPRRVMSTLRYLAARPPLHSADLPQVAESWRDAPGVFRVACQGCATWRGGSCPPTSIAPHKRTGRWSIGLLVVSLDA